MEKNKHIDNLFKEELGSYSETPPPAVWDALEKRLNEKRKKPGFPYRWLWYISIVSFIVLLGASVIWKMRGDVHPDAAIAASTEATNAKSPDAASQTTTVVPGEVHANNTSAIKQHKIKKSTADNVSETKIAVKHTSNKRKHHEAINTPTTKKTYTHDDLYADTDDDQYTVGYSSSSRKTNGASDESDEQVSGYTVVQSSGHNIVATQTDPNEHLTETAYGSRPHISAQNTQRIPQSANIETLNTHQSVANNIPHKHRATVARTPVAAPVKQNTNAETKAPKAEFASGTRHKRSRITTKDRTSSIPVVAAAAPAIKTKSVVTHDAPTAPIHNKQPKVITNTGEVALNNTSKHKTEKVAAVPNKKEATVAVNTNSNTSTAVSQPVAATNKADKNTTVSTTKTTTSKTNVVTNTSAPIAQAEKTAVTTRTHPEQDKNVKTGSTKVAATNNYASSPANNEKKTSRKVTDNNPQTKAIDSKPVLALKKADKKIAEKPVAAAIPAKTTATGKEAPAASKKAGKDAVAVKENNKPTSNIVNRVDKKVKADKVTAAQSTAIAKNENKPGKKETGRKSGNNVNSTPPTPAPVNIFSSIFSRRAIEQETIVADNVKVNTFTGQKPDAIDEYEQLLPSTFKKNEPLSKPDSLATNGKDESAKHSLFSKKFEAGVKGGYETGFSKGGANKFVVSPYLQYNLNDKFSLMTQPAVKMSHVNSTGVGDRHVYFDTSGATRTYAGSSAIYIINSGVADTIGQMQRYAYSQKNDSTVKSYNYGGTYVEAELPILLKYKIIPRLSVYGGANIVYSKILPVNEKTYHQAVTRYDTIPLPALYGQPFPLPPDASKVITYSGAPISSYKGPLYPSNKGDLLRLGYMLGLSYEYKKRWLFDVLVQQAMVKPNYEGGTNTNAPLALPYFRFTVGYKLTK